MSLLLRISRKFGFVWAALVSAFEAIRVSDLFVFSDANIASTGDDQTNCIDLQLVRRDRDTPRMDRSWRECFEQARERSE